MNSRKKIFIFGICVCLLIAGIMYTAIAGANDGFLDGENDSSQALETKENSGEISSEVSDDSSAAENTDSNGAGKNNQAEQIELSEAQIEEICSQAERYLGLINSEKKIGELTNAQITELKKDYAATGYISLKKLLEITGSIEKDLPMITLAQVEEICKAPNILAIKEGKTEKTPADSKAELIKKFNEIAGAPDWMVQSGFDMEYMYYLNKDGTDYVEITNTWIRRVFKDQTTGEKTINYFFESDRLAVEKAEKEFAEEIKNHPYEGMTFFNYYYKYATAEQKAELDKIKVVVRENEDVGTATSHYYAKKILQIVGEVPEDSPMLTLEYVKKVCTDPEMIAMREAISSTGVPKLDKRNAFAEAITAEFDQIAGAPDVTSGVGRSVYFLNEAHTEYIRFDGSAVFHVVVDENGHAFNKVELFDNSVLIKDGVYVGNSN